MSVYRQGYVISTPAVKARGRKTRSVRKRRAFSGGLARRNSPQETESREEEGSPRVSRVTMMVAEENASLC